MLFEEATKKICPYLNKNCITEECMFWETTIDGEKEVDIKQEPYDMTPGDARYWIASLKKDGYRNIGRQNGFRDYYAKYEVCKEGICKIREK